MEQTLGTSGALLTLCALLWACQATAAAAATAQISKLTDVTFSALDPLSSTSSSQSLCVYASGINYTVTASGSGISSAFTLSAGVSLPPLAYSVAWSASTGQTTGTALTSGSPFSGGAAALGPACGLGIGSTASLIVSLAASDLQGAIATLTYTGTLTITIRAL